MHFGIVAKETGIPIKAVQSYFEVLDDTLIANRLGRAPDPGVRGTLVWEDQQRCRVPISRG